MFEAIPLQILCAALAVALSVLIQVAGFNRITAFLDSWGARPRRNGRSWRATTMGLIVYLVFLLHLLQIAVYAGIYMVTGAVQPFESALYFSAATFTTVGGGAVRTEQHWQLFAALEALSGMVLVGWSVSYLVAVVHRLRLASDEQ